MLTALVVIESVSLAASLAALGVGFVAYRKLNKKLRQAQQRADEARGQLKRFLESCVAALN